jgi:hypothetical protein
MDVLAGDIRRFPLSDLNLGLSDVLAFFESQHELYCESPMGCHDICPLQDFIGDLFCRSFDEQVDNLPPYHLLNRTIDYRDAVYESEYLRVWKRLAVVEMPLHLVEYLQRENIHFQAMGALVNAAQQRKLFLVDSVVLEVVSEMIVQFKSQGPVNDEGKDRGILFQAKTEDIVVGWPASLRSQYCLIEKDFGVREYFLMPWNSRDI